MARYALVGPGDVIRAEKDESRIDLTAGTRDGYDWRIIENVTDDQSTGPDTVMEPMVETIEPTRVLRTRVIRDMTQAEIDARIEELADSVLVNSSGTVPLGKIIAEVIFRVSNGNTPVGLTRAQARSWVRTNFIDFAKE